MSTGSFSGVKCGRGVLMTTHPLQAPRSWKSRAITLPPPLGQNQACNGVKKYIKRKPKSLIKNTQISST